MLLVVLHNIFKHQLTSFQMARPCNKKTAFMKKHRLRTHCLHILQGQSVYIKFWFGFGLTFQVCFVSAGTKGHYGGCHLFDECLIGIRNFENVWWCWMKMIYSMKICFQIRHYSPELKTLCLLTKFRSFSTIFRSL